MANSGGELAGFAEMMRGLVERLQVDAGQSHNEKNTGREVMANDVTIF